MINDLKNIVGISGYIMAARVVGMLLALAWTILVTRNMEVNHVGQMIFGISICNLLAMFVSMNMGAVAIKFIPSYMADKNANRIRGYLNTGNYLVIIIAVIISIFVTCIYYWQLFTSSEIIPAYILLSLLSAPLLGWIQLQASYIRAYEKVLLSVIPAFLLQPIIMLVLIWIGIVLGIITNTVHLMLAYFITLLIVIFVQIIVFRKVLSKTTNYKADYSELTRWLTQALQLIIPLLFIQNATQTIVVLSGGVLTEEEIAVLGVTLRIMTLLLFSVGAITMASNPKISREFHAKDNTAVKNTLETSALVKIILAVLGCLTVLGFGEYILGFFGKQYIVGHAALLILSFVPIVTAVFGPVVFFVTLLNLHLYSLVVFLITIILLAALIFVLGGAYGVIGEAYAVLIAWVFWNMCLYAVIRFKSGHDVSIFSLLNRQPSK